MGEDWGKVMAALLIENTITVGDKSEPHTMRRPPTRIHAGARAPTMMLTPVADDAKPHTTPEHDKHSRASLLMHDRSTTIGAYIDLPLFPPGLAVSNEKFTIVGFVQKNQKNAKSSRGFGNKKGAKKWGAPARSRKIRHIRICRVASPPPEAATGYNAYQQLHIGNWWRM